MDDRRSLALELDEIQLEIKELEIRYEQYFAGIERREPYNERKNLARRLRQFTNRHIVWTDLKFRYQGMSYGQYWDRILRLIEEGKYPRHKNKLKSSSLSQPKERRKPVCPLEEARKLHQQLNQAREAFGLAGDGPSADKVATFITTQRGKIYERYGKQPVEFSIDTSGSKPRIKVSLKK
jgi:hypothetical protein